ncbi:MAG: hypothetical protein DRJ38_07140 [Thermoprotei archaeon]|nr:MAG: hypothetical protein DRJ38_07140 [Thermoprotei archaeon]
MSCFEVGEIASFLSQLIQVDTSNPPGNELEAAKLVAEKLSELGIESQVLESEKNRGNVVAKIQSGEPGPTLLLLSHLDVVPAKPQEWKHDPFSGLIKDGFVWGRGALDCKGLVAVELFAFAEIVSRKAFKGTLIFAATADEEKGGRRGVGWLIKNKPDLIKADYVLNEGGGFEFPTPKGSLFLVQTAEKGVYWFKLRFKGKPGHASMPGIGENAVVKAARCIDRIASAKPPIRATLHTKFFLKNLLEMYGKKWISSFLLNPYTVDYALKKFPDKSHAMFIEAMLRNTLAPTIVKGGEKENIIPSCCELVVDCRLLPGYSEKWVKDYLRRILKDVDYELEFLQKEPPSESPIETPLYKAIEEALRELIPNARATPFMVTGGTDSRYFRRIFSSVAYGFHPIRSDLPFKEILSMAHGVNERISLKNLEFSYKVLVKTIEKFYKLL